MTAQPTSTPVAARVVFDGVMPVVHSKRSVRRAGAAATVSTRMGRARHARRREPTLNWRSAGAIAASAAPT